MNRLQNEEEMGFFDYLFLGALFSKFKNTLKNHNDSTYSNHSYTYNNSDDYDDDPVDPLLDDLGQDMFVEYDDPLYDEENLYEEDLYDDDLYNEDGYDDDYYEDGYDDDFDDR